LPNRIINLLVDEQWHEQRLDRYLNHQLKDKKREEIRRLILIGAVRCNKHVVRQPAELLSKGDMLVVDLQHRHNVILGPPWQQKLAIRIVYIDRDIVVIDKKEGIASVAMHAKDRSNATHLLKDFISKKYRGKVPVVFIVHRLDRATSGLLLFARHREAQAKLKEALREKRIERRYLALVSGHLEANAGRFTDKLDTHADNPRLRTVTEDAEQGENAITDYQVRAHLRGCDLLDLRLQTGRTHQIRVQLFHRGHAILGDQKYVLPNNKNITNHPQMALHAYMLRLKHPVNGRNLEFEAPLPDYMSKAIERLKS
jgi:23S rRNA pseudouridine1911/1915/1917 synthase